MSALYLCYQSLLDPLTQTQVVAYLEGLSLAGYRMVLLTFEPRRLTAEECREWGQRLQAKGVVWHSCRYHKRPTVVATAFDILQGIVVGWWLVWRYRVRLLHARSHVPGLMALVLRVLTGARFLFDIRGLMAEEYVDAGVWKAGGVLFRVTKRVERYLVQAADGIVLLTHRALALLTCWYAHEMRNKRVRVIPCCVDFRMAADLVAVRVRQPKLARIAYVGKLGGFYPVRDMTDFFCIASTLVPDLWWDIWTQSDPDVVRPLLSEYGLEHRVRIGHCPSESIVGTISDTQAGLCLYDRKLSAAACSPTKVGEYLAAGIPVVCSAGVGDMDELVDPPPQSARAPVGVLVRERSPGAYCQAVCRLIALIGDPTTSARCRAAAQEHFHLERVGWARYASIYRELMR